MHRGNSILSDRVDFKNPINLIARSTFGNPFLKEKFNKKQFVNSQCL